jgi:YegS/Rv2252/BmrU family lipid kinase
LLELLVNPSSGGGRALKALPRVRARLGELGLEHALHETRSLDHARELAAAAAEQGRTVVTLSGDGLVGAVAGVLRGRDATLGVLPGGRGNDFARVAGIPRDPVAACDVLVQGTARPIDVGEVVGADGVARTFIGIASLGFDSDANRIANEAPSRLGPLVYLYGALRALAAWKPATFELELDGEPVTVRGWSVAGANSAAYGGGMYVAPDAALDDGLLDVVTSAETGKATFLRVLPKVFKGRHVDEPSVEVRRAREVRVRADRPFEVYADGDPIGALPATIRAVPGALRVLLP